MILLDTHVLMWIVEDNGRLRRRGRELAEAAAAEQAVLVSVISFWEIGLLIAKGRLSLSRSLAAFAADLAGNDAFTIVPVNSGCAVEAGSLPGGIHGDPGDRILVATARQFACPILTADKPILDYAAEGHVQAIDARL